MTGTEYRTSQSSLSYQAYIQKLLHAISVFENLSNIGLKTEN